MLGRACAESPLAFESLLQLVEMLRRVGAGDIRGFADMTRFLLEPALRIAAILKGAALDEADDAILLTRLELGLPQDALSLTALKVRLSRGQYLALYNAGFRTVDAVRDLNRIHLFALVEIGAGKALLRSFTP